MPARDELSAYILASKYAKYDKSKKRRETYEEAVDRVRRMMLKKYPHMAKSIDWAYGFARDRKVLGSQRALQFGGEAIEKRNVRIMNCSGSFADRVRFFQEAFWLLLCGCGVGFSVQRQHVAKLPGFVDRAGGVETTFVIPDTIEGWADAAGILLESYLVEAKVVTFVYDEIRKEGSPISTGGKAPGPEPLRKALEKVRALLDRCIAEGRTHLRPLDAFDVVMHLADAVLSGGVRRSATIALFSADDHEMAAAKTGNWYVDNPQRARANISALRLRNSTTFEEYKASFDNAREWGEPGDYWASHQDMITNPCGEVSFWPMLADDDGVSSGWQFCNLSSVNVSTVRSRRDFLDRCRAAAVIGTLQAGFTDYAYLGSVSEDITKREALLGVSMTGMMDKPEYSLDPALLEQGVAAIAKANDEIAAKIGINRAARLTALKPEGTGSLLLGTLAAGRHGWPFRRGIRHVQGNRLEPPLAFFASHNPHAVEQSAWSANDTDDVLAFPIEAPEGAVLESEMSALESLEQVKLLQQHWINPGRRPDLCTRPYLQNSVSNTIKVGPDEWDAVARKIFDDNEFYTGVSLLARSGDKDYRQAPNVSVLTADELRAKYGEVAVAAARLLVFNTEYKAIFDGLWDYCDAILGVKKGLRPSQVVAVSQARTQLSEPYFYGDARTTTHLLKDVFYSNRYEQLVREWRSVPYAEMVEDEDNTNVGLEVACSGGACLL
jgi:ribonucleoside-diphosphate reductase alpha chain